MVVAIGVHTSLATYLSFSKYRVYEYNVVSLVLQALGLLDTWITHVQQHFLEPKFSISLNGTLKGLVI